MDILLLNGVNLNTLGLREKKYYGDTKLTDIVRDVALIVELHNFSFEHLQSNSEEDMINKIHTANAKFIIINPAAWTHSSIAIRDALLAVEAKFIELHISNIFQREDFRHKSYFSDIAIGSIIGLGVIGYELAAKYAVNYLQNNKE